MLNGAWRREVPPLELTPPQFEHAARLLLMSGAGGLAWWRARTTACAGTAIAPSLRQALRDQAMHAAVHEEHVARVFELLERAAPDAVMAKGWAIARCYAQRGLRPCGDVDVYVPLAQHEAARAALRAPGGGAADLHAGFAELSDVDPGLICQAAVRHRVLEAEVRVLGPEHHLRLVALHMLRHGALRPIWLCDVAAAVEARPARFDWESFAQGRRGRRAMIAVELAHRILGASVDGLPARLRPALPAWMEPAVLREWGAPRPAHGARRPMASYLRQPRGVVSALRQRWPNAVEATAALGAPFNGWPRLPLQLGTCLLRGLRFTVDLPRGGG